MTLYENPFFKKKGIQIKLEYLAQRDCLAQTEQEFSLQVSDASGSISRDVTLAVTNNKPTNSKKCIDGEGFHAVPLEANKAVVLPL